MYAISTKSNLPTLLSVCFTCAGRPRASCMENVVDYGLWIALCIALQSLTSDTYDISGCGEAQFGYNSIVHASNWWTQNCSMETEQRAQNLYAHARRTGPTMGRVPAYNSSVLHTALHTTLHGGGHLAPLPPSSAPVKALVLGFSTAPLMYPKKGPAISSWHPAWSPRSSPTPAACRQSRR